MTVCMQMNWFYRLTCRLIRTHLKLFHRFHVEGVDHVPRQGGCLLVANHVSFLDPPVGGVAVRHRMVHFLARDTLFRNRMFGWCLHRLGVIPLHRAGNDVGALRRAMVTGLDVLKSGHVLAMFPEGTRSSDGQLQEPKGGAGYLMVRAGVPVVPVYIGGTFEVWPRQRLLPRLGRIWIRFGAPILPAEFAGPAPKEAAGYASRLAMERIAQLRDMGPPA